METRFNFLANRVGKILKPRDEWTHKNISAGFLASARRNRLVKIQPLSE
jgi:hypothetical protein